VRGLACLAVVCSAVLALGADAAVAAPTKAQFIRQGDALCANVIRELVPLRRRAEALKALPESQQFAVAAAIWRDQIAIQSRFNARFRALGVPAGDRAARSLVSGLDHGLALARAVRDAIVARDAGRLATAVPAYVRFTTSLNRRVQAYGFRVCGR
jgi:hypothetical protein